MTKPEVYTKVARRYLDRRNNVKEASNGAHSLFLDVSGNILGTLCGRAEIMEQKKQVTPRDRKCFLNSLRKIKKYYKLVDTYSDFRAGELTPEGKFPDIIAFLRSSKGARELRRTGLGIQTHYVYLAEQRLEEKAQNGRL